MNHVIARNTSFHCNRHSSKSHDERAFQRVLADPISAHVSGSTLGAAEGQNLTITFKCDLEIIFEVRIRYEGGNQKNSLIGKYCSGDAGPNCKSMEKNGVSLQVEGGNVFLVLHDVNMSRSGLYEAQAFFKEKVCERNAMLVVNEASFSSSAAPPQTSIPNPPDSHHLPDSRLHLLWLLVLIPLIVLVGVLFCKHRRILCFQGKEVENGCNYCVSVDMNDSGENAEALLPS